MKNEQLHTGAGPASGIELPVVITSIQPQKKSRERYSLFHDEAFITGISIDTLIHFNLKKGSLLTSELYSRIEAEEQRRRVREYLLRLLGRRDHARKELETKAKKKGFRLAEITTVIEELHSLGYVNDLAFAEKFISDKMTLQKWGPEKIRYELLKKGIKRDTVQNLLKELPEDLQLEQICVDLVVKRKRHFSRESDSLKRRRKIMAFLQRKGFHFETINRALPEILKKLDV